MSSNVGNREWASTEELIAALHGPHNYLPTSFHADYALNVEGMRQNVANHADERPMTVVVGGGYGEGLPFMPRAA